MKKILLFVLLSFSISMVYGQNDTWKKLGKITYKKQFDELLGFKVDVPVFGKDIKEMEGKEVTVRGYIIPTNGYKSQTEFVFSAFPYNMCFFCGGAGPETVMEVYAVEGIAYTTEPVTLKGILSTNSGDINRLMYSISKAKKIN
jgi:hypothetical protein